MTKNIKNIIFDIGNVMVKFRWADLMADLGIEKENIEFLGSQIFSQGYWSELDRGVLPEEELIEKIIALCPGHEEELKRFFRYREGLVEQFEYVDEWLSSLKERGYHLYYLSNYPKSFFELHSKDRFRFLEYMDGGLASYQVHMVKPEPEIYECFLQKYHLDPGECVFLDDLKENIRGANQEGMKGIVFESYEQASAKLEEYLSVKE